jgi:hypothetical protein
LTSDDIDYLKELAMRYITMRIPDLETQPERQLAKAESQSAA